MGVASNLRNITFAALLSVSTGLTGTSAQEQERSTASSQHQSPVEANAAPATVAQVGAGTTSGSTTGSSGPESTVDVGPGENSLPPLPDADLCEPYQDTPAHQACLSVVLRED